MENAMRTTLDLPDDLLCEAITVTGIPTKTKVIVTALEGLVRKSKLAGLKEFKGKIDLAIDLDTLRDRHAGIDR
jgi:Arc/MetJ family transcription regulator